MWKKEEENLGERQEGEKGKKMFSVKFLDKHFKK